MRRPNEEIAGLEPYRIDAVVKFGGSLLAREDVGRSAIAGIEEAARAGFRLLVIPGGGPTDNAIEAIDHQVPLAPDTHHRACARAQDQTGLMICDPAFSSSLQACETLEEARHALKSSKTPVLLPSRVIFTVDPFERSWDLTSDGMALWFAWLVEAPRAAILTDVDGIYPAGADFKEEMPLASIRASELLEWGATAVDLCTPHLALRRHIETWVLHGGHSGRLLQALQGEDPIGTRIIPS